MIIVECYRDRALVLDGMHFTPDQVRHAHSKGLVLSALDKVGSQAAGVVDKDPGAGEHPSMKQYEEKAVEGEIRLLIGKDDNGKRVIEISPRLEDWLYGIAERNRISPEEFGLPANPEKLHVMSLRTGKNRNNFQRFLYALRERNEFNTLREWIKEAIAE